MSESRQAYRIRRALEHGLDDIPPAALRRLEAARHLAVSRQKLPATETAIELAGAHGFSSGSVAAPTPRHIPYARQILAITALLIGMWLSFYWHSNQYVHELEEVDSALLADDLDPEVLMDPDLLEWLKDNSLEE